MPLFSKLIVFIAIEIVMEKVIKSFVRSYVNFLPLTLALPLMNSQTDVCRLKYLLFGRSNHCF